METLDATEVMSVKESKWRSREEEESRGGIEMRVKGDPRSWISEILVVGGAAIHCVDLCFFFPFFQGIGRRGPIR